LCKESIGRFSMSTLPLPSNSLPPDLASFVADQLAQGKYPSASDVVCDAVRLLREREERRRALQTDIDQGLVQLANGDFIELDSDSAIDEFFADVVIRAAARNGAHGDSP
jgi:antitoxin ParD1/3/4